MGEQIQRQSVPLFPSTFICHSSCPDPEPNGGREKDIRKFLQLSRFNESCSNLNALRVRSTIAVIVPTFLVSSKIIQIILVLALLSLLIPNV